MNLPIINLNLSGFWIALFVSSLATAPLMALLVQMKSRQTISAYVAEHQAKQGTPTMGGLITVFGALLTWAVLACFGFQDLVEPIVLFVGFAIIGFVDDYVVPRVFVGKRGLGWKQKILLELLFTLVPILVFEHRTPFALFGGVYLILSFANAYNFTDGLDGLAGSVGLALLGGLVVLCSLPGLEKGAMVDQMLCLVIIATFIPFLYLNAPPAKVFMGDVGSMPIGAIIGLVFWHLATMPGASYKGDLGLLVMSLVMCAEIFPVPIQVAAFKLFKKRVFLMTPIHHGFQKRGIPETRIVVRYALAQMVLSATGVCIFWWSKPSVYSLMPFWRGK